MLEEDEVSNIIATRFSIGDHCVRHIVVYYLTNPFQLSFCANKDKIDFVIKAINAVRDMMHGRR